MGCSLDELRRKLTDPHSPLAPWWQHLLTLARQDPVWYSSYTVLAAVVTDDPSDRALARRAFLRFVELKEEGDTSKDAQLHTHVTTAPLARWAAFYDWVADLGLFSAEEDAAIRRAMLDHAYVFALQHVRSRVRSFDNQILSSAFCAATVGYLLGIRRGNDPAARYMYAQGMQCLRDVLSKVPASGYSLEGSTYQEGVVFPVVSLAGMFLEETTGEPVFSEGLSPNYRPLKNVLEMSWRMIGPDALQPPWDAASFTAAVGKCGLACLAKITRDPRPLATIRDCGMWYRLALPAWDHDDRLWTLVWWPSEIDSQQPAEFPSWMVPDTAGALQSRDRELRLFQYWDECGGIASSGRTQVDPNSIAFEAFHSPLLLDGYGQPGDQILPVPVDAVIARAGIRTLETIQEYIRSAWNVETSLADAAKYAVNGSLGMSNCLVLDGETWHVPLQPCAGRGEALHRVGPLDVLRGNVTGHYADRYDVTRVTRTSLLVRGAYCLVSDRVTARSPHVVTWQAYAREKCAVEGERVVLRTPEQVRCDVVPLQAGPWVCTPVPGYPTYPDKRSVLVKYTLPAAADVRLDMALVPQSGLRLLADLTDGWDRRIAGKTDAVSLATAHLSDPATHPDEPRVYRRTFTVPYGHGERLFLTIHAATMFSTVMVNGATVAPLVDQNYANSNWRNSSPLPWTLDITAAVRAGENVLVITAPFFHGESVLGPAQLFSGQEPEPVTIERLSAHSFRVQIGADEDLVLVENESGLTAWAGGETDARYALLTADKTLAAADVRRLTIPGLVDFNSAEPRDVLWTSAQGLQIRPRPCAPTVTAATPRRKAQEVATSTARPTPAHVGGGMPLTMADVHALAETDPERARPRLLAALRGGDWRVQLAAADVIGQLGIKEAVPILLDLFAEAETELPYPTLTKWWRWSKMLRAPGWEEGPDASLPLPISVKRWRVKRAVVFALGKLGDARAVAPLEAAMIRCNDFFPVTSVLPIALARLGSPSSIPVLERNIEHAELNTRLHARLGLALLKGEMDRAAFEERLGFD